MLNEYEIASQILNNLKLTSDPVSFEDCYYLCAQKQHIKDLKIDASQVIWGRRGTGKTTLQKAFVYDINYIQQDPNKVAIYIILSKLIPTDIEINTDADSISNLAFYVFIRIIEAVCKELEDVYNIRSGAMESSSEKEFMKAFFELQDRIDLYYKQVHGAVLTIEQKESEETNKNTGGEIGVNTDIKYKWISGLLKGGYRFWKKRQTKNSVNLQGPLNVLVETSIIDKCLSKMIRALNITLLYICLDEYSEMDKISEYSIQSKVAQLLKQVFLKNKLYSLKIASIWNKSKLHSRGGPRFEGIEYKQDIFEGPDLDIMFMTENINVVDYFKELLINTYALNIDIEENEHVCLSNYIENNVFGAVGLKHLICGSQGVSRAFVCLAKKYIQEFLRNNNGVVRLGKVYSFIKQQYLEDVREKIPYYTIYRTINTFVSQKCCRYFLISREDYQRCKSILLFLQSRGLFMQMPGHLTDRAIRDDYKLFIIHYGCYLDAIESQTSYKKGRKNLEEDSKLKDNGSLFPKYDLNLIKQPSNYTIKIPNNSEKEIYCEKCRKVVQTNEKGIKIHCPECSTELYRFLEFLDEMSI